MASEFDNEIDFLLRQQAATARQTDLTPANTANASHLDADDLSAFAENALPDATRLAFVSHLADCNSCRIILSNLILLNEMAAQELAVTSEPEKSIAAKSGWLNLFKNLFAFPAFGYATAALAILLVGAFAFVAVRQTQENRLNAVAKIEPEEAETQIKKPAAAHVPTAVKEESESKPAEVPAETPDSNIDVPAESAPTSANSSPVDNLPPSVIATRGGINRNTALPNLAAARNDTSANNLSNLTADASATPIAQPQTESSTGAGAVLSKPGAPEDQIARATASAPRIEEKAQEQLRERSINQAADDEDKSNLKDIAPATTSAAEKQQVASANSSLARGVNKKVLTETRTIGGKTFQKIGSLWRDSTYNSQNLITISRKSAEYKKLETNLRSVIESLDGEVIILWRDKAYRIQ